MTKEKSFITLTPGHHRGARPGQEVRRALISGPRSLPERGVHPLRGRPQRRDEDSGAGATKVLLYQIPPQ